MLKKFSLFILDIIISCLKIDLGFVDAASPNSMVESNDDPWAQRVSFYPGIYIG